MKKNKTSNIKNVNLIMIPKIVESIIDSNIIYKHKYLNDIKNINKEKQYKMFNTSSKQNDPNTFYTQIKHIINDNIFESKCDDTVTIIIDRTTDDNKQMDIVNVYNVA
eukprot:237973_1